MKIKHWIAVFLGIASTGCNTMNANDNGPLHAASVMKPQLPNLKKGLSIASCKVVMGQPTIERKEFAKERSVQIGTSLYYVVRKTGERLNPATDSYVQLSFDRAGKLVEIAKYNL